MRGLPGCTLKTTSCGLRGSAMAALTAMAVILCAQAVPSAETPKERSLQILNERYRQSHAAFAQKMEELAVYCEQQSFAAEAALLRTRSGDFKTLEPVLDQLPEQIVPEPAPSLPEAQRVWQVAHRKLETEFAAELYKLSRDALRTHPSLSFQLIREVAWHDPNHKFARSFLGYARDGNAWTTPFAKLQRSRRLVDHPVYGWLRERDVPRYEAGERFYLGDWMSAEKEAALRSDFRNAWVIETEHFVITTNHSLEAGVQIGRELERFHRFFIREFAMFFNTREQMQALFAKGAGASRESRQHQVYYFKSRQEYVDALIARQPQIAITNGLYMPADRVAYLYHDPEKPGHMSTIYHEVTHQLLGETTSQSFDVAENANFWLIEGFACYIETVRSAAGSLTVGTPTDDRIYYARKRLVEENFFIPFEQFTRLGKDGFRASTDQLPQYYSQAAGMAHFFVHYNNGVYRDAFIEHMSLVYSPMQRTRLNAPTLDKLTEVPFPNLDQQYRDYIATLSVD